jgi:hypothetical protein
VKVTVPYEVHEGKIVDVSLNLSDELITEILVLWLSARVVLSCLRSGVMVVVSATNGSDEVDESAKIAISNVQKMCDIVHDDSALSVTMFPVLNLLGTTALIENIKLAIRAFETEDDNLCHCQICSAVREAMVENGAVLVTVGRIIKKLFSSDGAMTSIDWVRLDEVLTNDDLSTSERNKDLMAQLAEISKSLSTDALSHKG